MATRSLKVRAVFAELRLALGKDIPAGELLQLAAALVDASYPRKDNDGKPDVRARPATDQVPLDKAFADGGWRIMDAEPRWIKEAIWDEVASSVVTNINTVKMDFAA